ncbi:MAG TPA: hypothetical protein VEC36_12925, partial [Patescibacteria group bacterium]|nr:hypothetical protein [Patescibacteria group bacterium]
MEDILLKIRETIRRLEKSPYMFLPVKPQDVHYQHLATFWHGYFYGLAVGLDVHFNSELSWWIQSKK